MNKTSRSQTTGVSRRSFFKGSAALISGAALLSNAGCIRKDGEIKETINYYIGNPVSIDPYNTQETSGTIVTRQLFDPLLDYNFKTSELVPVACESYTSNADGTEFTFKIKQGNTFHNGEVVDAHAFKRGWDRLCNPYAGSSPSVVSYYLQNVEGYQDVVSGNATELTGLSCPDDYTLRVKLTTPFVDFPLVCTLLCLAPIPKVALDDFEAFFLAPVGNGPYRMDGKWEDGQHIYVTAYEDYKNGEFPRIKNVHFDIQKDVETGFREFEADNIDICDLPTSQTKDMVSLHGSSTDGYTITPNHQVLLGDQPSSYYLTININDPVMKDVNLRRACSLAINRENLANVIMEGTRLAADNLVPPHVLGYVEKQWPYARYDKEAALVLLDQYYPKDANGDRNIKITLAYNVDGSHKQIMESVAMDLEAVGIHVEQETKEWAAILTDYKSQNYQMGRGGWLAEYPSIDDFLYPLLYSGNGDNTSGFSNARFDELILEARKTTDEGKRLSLYYEANKLAANEVPYIPLMFYTMSKIGSSRIKQAYINPIMICSAASWELE